MRKPQPFDSDTLLAPLLGTQLERVIAAADFLAAMRQIGQHAILEDDTRRTIQLYAAEDPARPELELPHLDIILQHDGQSVCGVAVEFFPTPDGTSFSEPHVALSVPLAVLAAEARGELHGDHSAIYHLPTVGQLAQTVGELLLTESVVV